MIYSRKSCTIRVAQGYPFCTSQNALYPWPPPIKWYWDDPQKQQQLKLGFACPLAGPYKKIMPSLGKQMRVCLLPVFREGTLLEWWQTLQMTKDFCHNMAFKWPASPVKCWYAWHLTHRLVWVWIKSFECIFTSYLTDTVRWGRLWT